MVDLVIMIMVSLALVLLLAAAALTVLRMSRGPSSLDRVVAADVLVAVVIAGLALEAIINDHTTTLAGHAGAVAARIRRLGRASPGLSPIGTRRAAGRSPILGSVRTRPARWRVSSDGG